MRRASKPHGDNSPADRRTLLRISDPCPCGKIIIRSECLNSLLLSRFLFSPKDTVTHSPGGCHYCEGSHRSGTSSPAHWSAWLSSTGPLLWRPVQYDPLGCIHRSAGRRSSRSPAPDAKALPPRGGCNCLTRALQACKPCTVGKTNCSKALNADTEG